MKIRIATLKRFRFYPSHFMNMPVLFMASHGNPTQWGTTYPPVDMIEHDIRMGNAYVCEENNRVIAVFTMHLKMMSLIHNLRRGTG